ncbi:HAD-IA family hydrolase [Sphingomonas sp. CCH5-D11]|uniref:HAD-IA family hydrolase n=1 Tax=Sphingomonas sp. CCH5-D11 TaxID=1768786 RepID=UPI000A638FEB|nr:HAD-IA family hydrolase [Sphingomonas sp. CCH5-D11]
MADQPISAILFDVKDTLGYVDRPGHLVIYKPSTMDLLRTCKEILRFRIGIITNLPADVLALAGRKMIEEAGIAEFVDPDGLVINHDVGVDKPDPRIFAYAAEKMGLRPDECLFVGENFAEVLGAQAAGMQAQLKPCPPGREFLFKPVSSRPSTEKDSGRLAEMIIEEDHLIGRRLVMAAAAIAKKIGAGEPPPLRAMGILVFLLNEFIDRYHHMVEERVLLPLAFAFGFPPTEAAYVYEDHERGRQYFKALGDALNQLRAGDEAAAEAFKDGLEGFVALYREHARRENDETLPRLGACLSEVEDALVVELMEHYGPGDLGPWLLLIANLERELEVRSGGSRMPEIKTVGVLAYHRCGEQDTLVPYEILKHTSMVLAEQGKSLEVKLIRSSREGPEFVEMQMGTRVVSEGYLESEDLFDLLFVPGGLGSGEASKDQRILAAVRRHHEAGKVVGTNCSGISILHRAGILDDTPVTAAATVARRLKEEGANLLQPRTMWAGKKDGTIWTSAGGSGVHGSTVAMVANYFGREVGQYIGMGWDTYPALGEKIFDERGPQYLSFPELEAGIQDALEDMLLPRKLALAAG